MGFLDQIPLRLSVFLLAVVLPWREPKTVMVKAPSSSMNKVCSIPSCHCKSTLYLPPPARGGSVESDGRYAIKVQGHEACSFRLVLISSEVVLLFAPLQGEVGGRRPAELGCRS